MEISEEFRDYVRNRTELRIGAEILDPAVKREDDGSSRDFMVILALDLFSKNPPLDRDITIDEYIESLRGRDEIESYALVTADEEPGELVTRPMLIRLVEKCGETALKACLYDKVVAIQDYEAKIPDLIAQNNFCNNGRTPNIISNDGPLEPSQATRPPLRIVEAGQA